MPGTTPTVDTVRWRAESPASRVQPRQRLEHRFDVGERLAHAHVDDVGDALRRVVLRAEDLLADLADVEVALEPGLAGRAERAAHRASGLRRDADGGAVAVAHEDGLDLRAVGGAPQPLDGHALVAALDGDGRRARAAAPLRARRAAPCRRSTARRADGAAPTARRTPARRDTAARRAPRSARGCRRGWRGSGAWRRQTASTSRA